MENIEKRFDEILKDYKSEFISFRDENSSDISKRNNKSFHKDKKEDLHRKLIIESKKYDDLNEKEISDMIYEFVNMFDLLIKPNSNS